MKAFGPALLGVSLLIAIGACGGCEQSLMKERSPAGVGPSEADASTGRCSAEVTLCRKVGKKSGKRIGVGNRFTSDKKSYVYAFVDFSGAEPGKTYSVHLVWIKPGGKEMYRKYAEVTLVEEAAGYQTHIRWRKAEEFGYLKEEAQTAATPSFSLSTRLNASTKKEREFGTYAFRVYLNRELYRDVTFELSDS